MHEPLVSASVHVGPRRWWLHTSLEPGATHWQEQTSAGEEGQGEGGGGLQCGPSTVSQCVRDGKEGESEVVLA